ncbi:MAG: 3-phosphoshikimate 1-carboxyvinyltransferase [Chloroflexi bacterium RBG_16_48_8]|nr:MAG: 3-phosphoshikimate 1-carboxyvinyltransferase [Chloroflexi bacterium RBG_16_48_8]
MKLEVKPASPLRGECTLPGDKSLSHRAALLAALAEGESRIENFLQAGVTKAMLRALGGLGVVWRLEGGSLIVEGEGPSRLHPPKQALDCGNSATTLRLLAGALAGANVRCVLDGSEGLRSRPMGRIVKPLREMGVPLKAAPGDVAPIQLVARREGTSLRALAIDLPVASAQVKSALLLAGLGAEGTMDLREPGPSRDHTERLLASMGVEIVTEAQAHRVRLKPPDSPLRPLRLRLPGDISSGAFLIVAALIVPGSDLILRDVGLNPTRVGLLDVLRKMGARMDILAQTEEHGEPKGDLRVRASELQGLQVDGPVVVRMIDEFPIFAVAAAMAEGQTVVAEAAELRHKESNRISALCRELRSIGVAIEEMHDGFVIDGGRRLRGGVHVQSHGDHRLAMALMVAGLAAEESVVVGGVETIEESFPEFADILRQLGAEVTD